MPKLQEVLENEFAFVLKRPTARLVSVQDFPRDFGNEVAVIEIYNLLVRFVCDRGDFDVYVAAKGVSKQWEPLTYAVAVARGENSAGPGETGVRANAIALDHNLDSILIAFSEANLPTTLVALQQLHLRMRLEWASRVQMGEEREK